jgi:hypothetical protein
MNKAYQRISSSSARGSILTLGVFILFNGIFIATVGIYLYGELSFFAIPLYLATLIVGLAAFGMVVKISANGNFTIPLMRLINVILVGSFVLSPFLSRGIGNLCDAYTRYQAKIIITGVEAYKLDHGYYPKSFSDISNDYVEKWPSAICLQPYKLFNWTNLEYKLEFCESDSPRLTVYSTDLFWMRIYIFASHQWSQYDASEYCSCCGSNYSPRANS